MTMTWFTHYKNGYGAIIAPQSHWLAQHQCKWTNKQPHTHTHTHTRNTRPPRKIVNWNGSFAGFQLSIDFSFSWSAVSLICDRGFRSLSLSFLLSRTKVQKIQKQIAVFLKFVIHTNRDYHKYHLSLAAVLLVLFFWLWVKVIGDAQRKREPSRNLPDGWFAYFFSLLLLLSSLVRNVCYVQRRTQYAFTYTHSHTLKHTRRQSYTTGTNKINLDYSTRTVTLGSCLRAYQLTSCQCYW